ncbi:MAG TPA: outer membrane protein assembly factor BamA [Candidatus Avalokitesvara rifleensis]|uniref:outer membrane protein assembly factor BamA n=1 Tax=Candidatus Avalokitesvara rifleensis TaxID=3367620 RepID=UPI0027122B32|nr:outer membrane protein assembly factor BamA [Candidatus Brocadiales bacterium]
MAYPTVKNLAVACIFAFFLVCGGLVQAQEGGEGKIIKQIEIKGNKRIGTAAIKGSIKLREGDPYNQETVSQDVSSIWAMGYFDNVDVVLEDIPGGLNLTFIVTERPVITSIEFEGNEDISDKKLRKVLEFQNRDYLKHYLIKLGEEKIKDLYLNKGYQFVKVSSKLEKSDGEVKVIYEIKEGPRVTIRKVLFEGNESFSDKKLRKQVKTRRKRFPGVLFRGIFDEEKFEGDKEKLKEFYVDRGWLDVKIEGRLTYSKDREYAVVTFVIDQGERYRVNKIEVKGNRLFSTAELFKDMELYIGGPFQPPVMEEDSRNIRTLYGEQGFVSARVIPKRIFSPVAAKVDLSYEINEGKRFYIEEIKIRGNERTEDHVIRRELLFSPGGRFDSVKIRDSHEKLMATGYFDKQSPMPVNMLSEQGSRPDLSNLLVEVKEGRSGVLRFGAGFGMNSGLFGDISYTDNNFNIADPPKNLRDFWSGDAFRGAGHVFDAKFSPGLKRTEAILSLSDPSIYDSVYSAGGSTFFFTRDRKEYTEQRLGNRFTLGRMITPTLSVGVTPGFERIKIEDVFLNAAQFIKEQAGTRKRLSGDLRVIWDKRNHPMFPTKGHLVDANFEISGIDVNIWKFVASAKKYYKVWEPEWWGAHVLRVGGTIGMVDSTTDSTVPIFERFFAGGLGSIRGFDFRGVAPVDPQTGEQIGGDSMVLYGIEDMFPIYKDLLKGVVFVDAGKADVNTGDIGFDRTRVSVGAGLRFNLPFFGRMTFGVDFGIAVKKETDDNTKLININVGGGG